MGSRTRRLSALQYFFGVYHFQLSAIIIHHLEHAHVSSALHLLNHGSASMLIAEASFVDEYHSESRVHRHRDLHTYVDHLGCVYLTLFKRKAIQEYFIFVERQSRDGELG